MLYCLCIGIDTIENKKILPENKLKSYKNIEDIKLYELLKDSNSKEAAFKELYSRHSARLFAYCKRILSNTEAAEDIFQEAFLVFLKSAEQDREMTNIPAFLLRIARNLALNKRREMKRKFVDVDSVDLRFDDNTVENREISELISRALELLPDDQREAVVLQNYQGMSYSEIATLQNVPVTTVRNWLVRGKRKLKDVLQPYFVIKN